MTRKGKSSLYKVANFLRNSLRILFLVIFLHWMLWLTSYANCVNYQEAISEKNVKAEEKIKEPGGKTKEYQRFTGWFNEKKEKNIGEIEDDVLSQIEEKKKQELGGKKLPRKWKEQETELKKLYQEKEELKKKENPTKEEKEALEKKEKECNEKFEEAKEKTSKNIENQLRENKLNITELDDDRNWWRQMTYDPLKFFIVSPLNKTSKMLGLHNRLFLEIIFKLVIIEIIFLWIYYSETTIVWENMEKIRDPYLSVEEKEQLQEEASPWVKYMFFNGFMVLLNFFIFFHPAFFDRTDPLFQPGVPWTGWFIWVVPLFIFFFLSNISIEFLRHGRLLNKQELKSYIAKNWVFNLFLTLAIMALTRLFGMNSIGNNLLTLFGRLVIFVINTARVKLFGHRERFPGGRTPGPTYYSKR
jgi:hypothetical protein